MTIAVYVWGREFLFIGQNARACVASRDAPAHTCMMGQGLSRLLLLLHSLQHAGVRAPQVTQPEACLSLRPDQDKHQACDS